MKRRSQPQQRTTKGTCGPKRAAGRMMYGPTKHLSPYPKFYERRHA